MSSSAASSSTYYRELVSLERAVEPDRDQWRMKRCRPSTFLDSLVSLPLLAEELGESLPLRAAAPGRCGQRGRLSGSAAQDCRSAVGGDADGRHAEKDRLSGTGDRRAGACVRLRWCTGAPRSWGRNAEHRDQYDMVTARAVAPLNMLAEYLLPLGAQGRAGGDLQRAGGAGGIYGGAAGHQDCWAATPCAWRRSRCRFWRKSVRFVLLVKKIAATPAQYPRGRDWRASVRSERRRHQALRRCSPCPDKRSCAGSEMTGSMYSTRTWGGTVSVMGA